MGPVYDTGARSEGRDIGDAVAFDDKGGLHIATPSGDYGYSGDGGKSWHVEAIPLPPRTRIKTQSITVDPAGVVHVACSARRWTAFGFLRRLLAIAHHRPHPRRKLDQSHRRAGGFSGLDENGGWRRRDGRLGQYRGRPPRGVLHLAWHGTAKSHKFAKDLAYYTWKKPGGPWQTPLLLPMPGNDVKLSHAPSMALEFFDPGDGVPRLQRHRRAAGLRHQP